VIPVANRLNPGDVVLVKALLGVNHVREADR